MPNENYLHVIIGGTLACGLARVGENISRKGAGETAVVPDRHVMQLIER